MKNYDFIPDEILEKFLVWYEYFVLPYKNQFSFLSDVVKFEKLEQLHQRFKLMETERGVKQFSKYPIGTQVKYKLDGLKEIYNGVVTGYRLIGGLWRIVIHDFTTKIDIPVIPANICEILKEHEK